MGVENTEHARQRLQQALDLSASVSVRKHRQTTMKYAKERLAAYGAGSATKKFVNIAGGRASDPELGRVRQHMVTLGYTAHIVPGPLMMATTQGKGGLRVPTLMPLSSGTVSGQAGAYLRRAALAVGERGDDPDLDVPASEVGKLKLTSHSLRRLTDGVVREYIEEHGLDPARYMRLERCREIHKTRAQKKLRTSLISPLPAHLLTDVGQRPDVRDRMSKNGLCVGLLQRSELWSDNAERLMTKREKICLMGYPVAPVVSDATAAQFPLPWAAMISVPTSWIFSQC